MKNYISLLALSLLIWNCEEQGTSVENFPSKAQEAHFETLEFQLSDDDYQRYQSKIKSYNKFFNEELYDSLIACIDPQLFDNLSEQDFTNALASGKKMGMKVSVKGDLKVLKSFEYKNKRYSLGTYPSITSLSTQLMNPEARDFYIKNIEDNPRMEIVTNNQENIEFEGSNYMLFIENKNTNEVFLLEYNPEQSGLLYQMYNKNIIDKFNALLSQQSDF